MNKEKSIKTFDSVSNKSSINSAELMNKENHLFETLIELGTEELLKYEGQKCANKDDNDSANMEHSEKDIGVKEYQNALILPRLKYSKRKEESLIKEVCDSKIKLLDMHLSEVNQSKMKLKKAE